MMTKDGTDTRQLFGVPIHAVTMEQTLAMVDEAIQSRGRLHIGVVNAAKIVKMQADPELRRSVLTSDIILADGMSVVWACRTLGRALPERIAGIDLMDAMLRQGNGRGYRVYLLGATPVVLDRAATRIRQDTPGVQIVGRRNGYFNEGEERSIAEDIRAARPDILLVGIQSPKKENFLGRWGEYMDVPVLHGVGGSLDVKAGLVRRAPDRWQRWGMEWLYRVLQEPRRMWRRYLVTNTVFGWMLVGELIRGRRTQHP